MRHSYRYEKSWAKRLLKAGLMHVLDCRQCG